MLHQMIRVWFRALLKHRLYTSVNVVGLALGVAAVIAIFLYVSDELVYDRYHTHSDRIYRIVVTNHFAGNETRWPTTAAPLAESIRNNSTSAEAVARIYSSQASVQLDDTSFTQKFRENDVWLADPDVFKIFSIPMIAGVPVERPDQVVLSRRTALKYFGSVEQAIGKDLLFEGRLPLAVSGVFEDFPSQSTWSAPLISHFENYYALESQDVQQYLHDDWIYNPLQTFILLRAGATPAEFEKEVTALKNRYGDARVKEASEFSLQPIHDIHLYSDFTFEGSPAIRKVEILSAIGLVILLIACVNFVNLTNVHSLKRAREIGIRKVLGAQKGGLASQFMLETGALVVIAFSLAVLCLSLMLPLVSSLTGKDLSINAMFTWRAVGGILVLFVVTAFMAGAYPSVYITRFNPIQVLKGITISRTGDGYLLRKILMTAQFTVSIVLVVLAIVLWEQMEFIRNQPLGFQKNGIVTIQLFSDTPNSVLGGGVDGAMRARMNGFEAEVLKNPTIEAITLSSLPPGTGFSTNALVSTDSIGESDNLLLPTLAVDYDFFETYRIELLAGRRFTREAGSDHLQSFIINERASRRLGWTDPSRAIGQRLSALGKNGTIVGVVQDFHFQGLQNVVAPLVMEVAAGKFTVFSVRMSTGARPIDAVEDLQREWNKAFPEKVFEYRFLDQILQNNYGDEQRMASMMQGFSILAIFISALGLFGLAAYVNHQRAKEVGIRKILGAGATQVFVELSREFVRMAVLAFVLAAPIAYFLGTSWLHTFAYRTDVSMFAFATSAVVAFVTVLTTISYETIRSTRINPTSVLRD